MREAARIHGAPDFNKRTFFRAVVDGQYKLVRWFSPNEYGNPSTLEELLSTGDVTLYDLVNDPGEGAQAKRRAHATLVDHLIPPMARAESYGSFEYRLTLIACVVMSCSQMV